MVVWNAYSDELASWMCFPGCVSSIQLCCLLTMKPLLLVAVQSSTKRVLLQSCSAEESQELQIVETCCNTCTLNTLEAFIETQTIVHFVCVSD